MLAVLFAQRFRIVPRVPTGGGTSAYEIGRILGIIFVVCLLVFLAAMLWRYLATTSWTVPSGRPRRRRKRPRREPSVEGRDDRREPEYGRPALSRDKVEPKARATHDLLLMVGERDPWFKP